MRQGSLFIPSAMHVPACTLLHGQEDSSPWQVNTVAVIHDWSQGSAWASAHMVSLCQKEYICASWPAVMRGRMCLLSCQELQILVEA